MSEQVHCAHCGRPRGQHRGADGRCPGRGDFPAWPSSAKDPGAAWDKRIARYWEERSTTFADPWRAWAADNREVLRTADEVDAERRDG